MSKRSRMRCPSSNPRKNIDEHVHRASSAGGPRPTTRFGSHAATSWRSPKAAAGCQTRSATLFLLVLVLTLCAACGRRAAVRSEPNAHSAALRAPQALPQLDCAELSHAYAAAGASADETYQGKRFTVLGSVVSVNEDGGAPRVVLGSKLEPVLALGVDKDAANALFPGARIELDCFVTGSIADIPQLDCGPNGVPRPMGAARDRVAHGSGS